MKPRIHTPHLLNKNDVSNNNNNDNNNLIAWNKYARIIEKEFTQDHPNRECNDNQIQDNKYIKDDEKYTKKDQSNNKKEEN